MLRARRLACTTTLLMPLSLVDRHHPAPFRPVRYRRAAPIRLTCHMRRREHFPPAPSGAALTSTQPASQALNNNRILFPVGCRRISFPSYSSCLSRAILSDTCTHPCCLPCHASPVPTNATMLRTALHAACCRILDRLVKFQWVWSIYAVLSGWDDSHGKASRSVVCFM